MLFYDLKMYLLLYLVWGPRRRCQVKTVAGCSSTLAAAPAASSWLPVPGNNAEAHSATTDPTTVPADHPAATTFAGKCFFNSHMANWPKKLKILVIPEGDWNVKKERYFPSRAHVVICHINLGACEMWYYAIALISTQTDVRVLLLSY